MSGKGTCAQCGASIFESDTECMGCGAKVLRAHHVSRSARGSRSRRWPRWLVVISGTAVAVGLTAFLGYLYGRPSLHEAVKSGDARAVEARLRAGADANAEDEDGYTPLLLVLRSDWSDPPNQQVLELLLEGGANANVATHDGSTLLHKAAAWGYTDTAALLLAHGADPSARMPPSGKEEYIYDGTPLHMAAFCGHPEVVALLLAHGAHSDSSSGSERRTPLHSACFCNFRARDPVAAARLLLEHGADVNARDSNADTPLGYAVSWDAAPEMVELLLAYRADVDATRQLRMAREGACSSLAPSPEVVQMLRAAAAWRSPVPPTTPSAEPNPFQHIPIGPTAPNGS